MPTAQAESKVEVSMVSLKWGDVLSLLLPGVVALFAISPYFPALYERVLKIDQASSTFGVVLLVGAAIAGGVLGAFTRIVWEPFWLMRRHRVPPEVMKRVKENKDLYERLVENSYKYVTFYANLAWATIILCATRIQQGMSWHGGGTVILVLTIIILVIASHVQWSYYVKSMNQFYSEGELPNVEKRAATGN
jgi:multisubunit Na+/H+ antiporter MnhG subunit